MKIVFKVVPIDCLPELQIFLLCIYVCFTTFGVHDWKTQKQKVHESKEMETQRGQLPCVES